MTTTTETSPEQPAEAPPGEFQPDPDTEPAYKPETPKRRHKTGRHVVMHGGGAGGLGAAATVLHMFGPTGLGIAAAGATAAVGGAIAYKNRRKQSKGKSSAARTVRTLTRRTKTQQTGGRAAAAGLRGGASARAARRTGAASGAAGAARGSAATRRPGAAGSRRAAGTGAAARRGPGVASTAAARRSRRAAAARGAKPSTTSRPGTAGRTRPSSGGAAKGASPKAATGRRGTPAKASRAKSARTRGSSARPIAATRPERSAARRGTRRAARPAAAPRTTAPKVTAPKTSAPKTSRPKATKPPRPANRQARIAAHTTRKRHVRYIKRAAATNPKVRNKPFGQQARAFAPEAKANVRKPTARKATNSTRKNSRNTTPRTGTRATGPRTNPRPRVVPGPHYTTPTPTVTVRVEPADTSGYTVRPGTPTQNHTTIHLPAGRSAVSNTRPALTGRIIPAPGTPTRSTPSMSNATIASLTEAVRDHLGSWQPESALDILGMISGLQDLYHELGSNVVNVGERLASDHPIDQSVTEALKQMGMATSQIGEYGSEVHATFRAAHAEDLRRLEEPRPGEHEWNTDYNN